MKLEKSKNEINRLREANEDLKQVYAKFTEQITEISAESHAFNDRNLNDDASIDSTRLQDSQTKYNEAINR